MPAEEQGLRELRLRRARRNENDDIVDGVGVLERVERELERLAPDDCATPGARLALDLAALAASAEDVHHAAVLVVELEVVEGLGLESLLDPDRAHRVLGLVGCADHDPIQGPTAREAVGVADVAGDLLRAGDGGGGGWLPARPRPRRLWAGALAQDDEHSDAGAHGRAEDEVGDQEPAADA